MIQTPILTFKDVSHIHPTYCAAPLQYTEYQRTTNQEQSTPPQSPYVERGKTANIIRGV